MKQTALVVCPGRGSYTKSELGYLKRFSRERKALIESFDEKLSAMGLLNITELDSADTYSLKTHTSGEHASMLTYALGALDFLEIDRERFEIVAVTGNSMGWYSTLAVCDSLRAGSDFTLIQTMGSMMRDEVIGAQMIYPLVDDNWQPDPKKKSALARAVELVQEQGHQIFPSIHFGGYGIIGGDRSGIKEVMAALEPIDDRFPFLLVGHGAFHTPLLREVSDRAFRALSLDHFCSPKIPMVDGRGHIWQPHATDVAALRDYTLGYQVVFPYDFTTALTVGVKEFAPDKIILLGPGNATGGAIGQVLVRLNWQGMQNKEDFLKRQTTDPLVLSMGLLEQRALAIKND
jgi:[acyl-carrier-protein] S-malonyltransferase